MEEEQILKTDTGEVVTESKVETGNRNWKHDLIAAVANW